MSKPSSGTWFKKITKFLQQEPQTKEEFLACLESARRHRVIDSDALMMIEGVMDVSQSRVRDVMIPRSQMVLLDESQTLEKMLEVMLETSHSRYPVLNEGRDTVVGVLLAKDVLSAVVKKTLNNQEDLAKIYREPMFVPESKRLNVLLRDFKASRNHMALVVDEYGELAGLVTIEDVLEQIVGEIEDEHDEEENAYIQKSHKGGYRVQAMTPIEVFNEFFHTQFENDKIETLGGLVAQKLGHIPQKGETITLEGLELTVKQADDRRAESFLVKPLEKNAEKAPEAHAETTSEKASTETTKAEESH